jgi:hypothetical protein
MSYITADTFSLPSKPAYQVRMKQAMSTGDWLAARDYWRTYKLPEDQESEDYSAALAQREIDSARHVIASLILGWNLTDDSDEPLAVTADNVLKLPQVDFVFLEEKATAVLAGRPVEAETPFANGSGRRSRATRSKRRPS